MTGPSETDRGPTGGVLPGASFDAHLHGLDCWHEGAAFHMAFWVAPPGTAAVLRVEGDGADAAELRWSTRCAEWPSTRAVALLDGPGSDGVVENFETAHRAAEEVARFVAERSGEDVGAIEVLVFRPDTTQTSHTTETADAADGTPVPGRATSTRPRPAETTDGAEFRFRHCGGARIHLTLTIPTTAGGA